MKGREGVRNPGTSNKLQADAVNPYFVTGIGLPGSTVFKTMSSTQLIRSKINRSNRLCRQEADTPGGCRLSWSAREKHGPKVGYINFR